MKPSKQSLQFLLVSLFCFFLFGLFSFLVKEDLMTSIDFDTTVRLQDNIPERVNFVFSLFSIVGHFEVMLIFLILFFIFKRKWIMGCIAFGSFGFFHVVELFGKTFVNHPPPPFFMLRTEHPIEFPQFYVSTESSYPSGHSGRAVFMSIILIYFVLQNRTMSNTVKGILISAILMYVFLMFVSRVYLGEHWVSDVVGGAFLAAGFSFGVLIFSATSLNRPFSSVKQEEKQQVK